MQLIILLFSMYVFVVQIYSKDSNEHFIINNNFTADKINKSLIGSIARGRKVFSSRKVNCLSCHQVPTKAKFQGNIGPSLEGIGSIYKRNELRLRVINSKLINPNTIMPAYFVNIQYPRTPSNLFNKTILTAQEVEDIVEYLYSLK
ncbi:MAG: sulfur oxidation c-type cytochrome SoxX [Rickettsiales bacterium]|nr:sulfur oxidation c-type cytochrome SoxX [Rickettsiales bacterium]OUV78968.1 MAG: sulfur oxidation c-type cytochrome SoxX [Rickettsiales bacterium TMED131]|tara:strand:- start:1679 stop:2116 length:438 start_codon:yes stop_codon:yes gene_type:complete